MSANVLISSSFAFDIITGTATRGSGDNSSPSAYDKVYIVHRDPTFSNERDMF